MILTGTDTNAQGNRSLLAVILQDIGVFGLMEKTELCLE